MLNESGESPGVSQASQQVNVLQSPRRWEYLRVGNSGGSHNGESSFYEGCVLPTAASNEEVIGEV